MWGGAAVRNDGGGGAVGGVAEAGEGKLACESYLMWCNNLFTKNLILKSYPKFGQYFLFLDETIKISDKVILFQDK